VFLKFIKKGGLYYQMLCQDKMKEQCIWKPDMCYSIRKMNLRQILGEHLLEVMLNPCSD